MFAGRVPVRCPPNNTYKLMRLVLRPKRGSIRDLLLLRKPQCISLAEQAV